MCSREDICLSGWKKSLLEAVCLDLLLPGSEQPAVWGGLFTLLTAQTVILGRKPPRLWGYARRGRETTWIKRSRIFTGTPTRLTVKCVFEGKWKGCVEASWSLKQRQHRLWFSVTSPTRGVNFGQCCESLCGRYKLQWELSEKNFVLLTQICWERLLSVPGDSREKNKAPTSARNHQQAPFLRRIYRSTLLACGLMETTSDNR